MRIFNELIKPVFVSPHELGYKSSVYVDEFIVGQKFEECFDTVLSTVSLLQELGFVIQPIKSIFVPTQKITFLGFETGTLNMTLTLTSKNKENKRNIAEALLLKQSCSIRTLASFLGNIVSWEIYFPHFKLHPIESYIKGTLNNKKWKY